jgi:branched-subunit amino acid transport protein
MTGIDHTTLWIVIIALAFGTYALRFVFIALLADRPMPAWLMRHLRYTAVAIIPALVTPLVVWPAATQGQLDAPRLAAAMVTLTVGWMTKNVLIAMFIGAVTFYGLHYLAG